MKKLLVSLLSVLMVLVLATPVCAEGNGTEDDPILIYNAEDLLDLSQSENYIYARLENDIDLTDLGNGSNYYINKFYGELDGNGKKISSSGPSLIYDFYGGEIKNLEWNVNSNGSYLIWQYAGDVSTERRFIDLTVSGHVENTGSNNNESPLIIYAAGNTYMENVSLKYDMTSPTYQGLFIGYEPYTGVSYTFKNCTVEGDYTASDIGVLFGNGSKSGSYGVHNITGTSDSAPTSELTVENLKITGSIKTTNSEPHILCGISYDETNYAKTENTLLENTEGEGNMSMLKAVTGYTVSFNKDGRLKIVLSSDANPKASSIEVVSEVYSNVYMVDTGISNGTMKLSVSETIPVIDGVSTYFSNLGKVRFYDGAEGDRSTTGVNGELETITVNGDVYYSVPRGNNGEIYTFGDSSVPKGDIRTSSAKVILYDKNGKIINIITSMIEESFGISDQVIKTDKEKYNEIDLSETSLNGGSWVDGDKEILDLRHTAFISLSGVLYPVDVIKTNITHVESIVLSSTELNLNVGDKQTINAQVNPENAVLKELTWHSSNARVAIVSSTGEVTALSEGKATIIVSTANGVYAECVVVVTEKTVEDPEPSKPSNPSRPSSPSKDLPSNTEECQKEFGKDYIYSKDLDACIIKYLVVDTSTK